MREKVIEYLRKHPGGERIRFIAGALDITNWDCSDILYKLRDEGIVKSEFIRVPANMEFYDLWTLVK